MDTSSAVDVGQTPRRTRRIPLRVKILLASSSLLVALIVAMLIFVNYQAAGFVSERIASDLEQGRDRVETAENERLEDLRLMARVVASFPELKALFSTGDIATIRDFLLSYQQQNRRAELLVALDPQGRVMARTDVAQPVPIPDAETRWTHPALAGQAATSVLVTVSGVYDAAAVAAEAGGTVFGFVIAGSSIDDALARRLREASQHEVIIYGERILGSTLAAANVPWPTRTAWEAATGSGGGLKSAAIAGESFAAMTLSMGPEGGPRPLIVLLRSRDRALAPYRRIQFGLLIIGLLAALAGVGGSAVLARTLTASVGQLVEGTRQVAAGNFDFRLDIRTGDEIGDLADSFNFMTQGLRERADMQKFVSRSTVEMIQASLHRDVSAGERVRLTIFFSDMRNFTATSERMAPEEVVKMLNTCLSLQADKVKKFHGDIDKYVGDAVVAIFSGEDMALNAIRCALEIQKELDAYNAAREGGVPIQVGIGLATGEVILGSIGSRDRQDFTVIGSHVNLCARLCSSAGPREILLSESTYTLVRDLIAAEPMEPLTVKGFSEPVSVYKMMPRG